MGFALTRGSPTHHPYTHTCTQVRQRRTDATKAALERAAQKAHAAAEASRQSMVATASIGGVAVTTAPTLSGGEEGSCSDSDASAAAAHTARTIGSNASEAQLVTAGSSKAQHDSSTATASASASASATASNPGSRWSLLAMLGAGAGDAQPILAATSTRAQCRFLIP